jgi:L-seryl-tRNA(Ser) seleniumtransferase
LVEAGPDDHFDLGALLASVRRDTACVFVPAHLLDGFSGVAQLATLVEAAHKLGVPVVVDAAYLSYPIDLLPQFAACGADLTCFSAKYFFGPNSGGFVSGKRQLVDIVAGLDFTCFESGKFRTFGRPFKMSRYDVAATALALREWVGLDHTKRWRDYANRVSVISKSLPPRTGVVARPCLFTMSEELVAGAAVNCLVLSFDQDAGLTAESVAKRLEAGDPVVATIVHGDSLVVSVDALLDGQELIVAERLARALGE